MICIAVLNNLIVNGSARFLNKLYANDIDISGTSTFASLSTTGNATIGGTFGVTGATTLTGKLTVNNVIEQHGDGIELYYSTPHIDFHYGNSTADYTSRIIENASGTLTITPKFSTPTATITTGNITTINSSTISNSGKITANDMEVMDTLKSYKWDISHVANLANDFTVSPTLQLASGATIQFTAINTTTRVCTFTVTDSSSISSDSLGGVTWSQYSKVKFTMNLNNVINSNCNGYLTAKMNSTAGTMTISGTLDNVTGLATGTAYNAEGATIMLYEVGAGSQSTTYPVGIRMTAYGSNKRSYIDIYGGTATSSWNTPHVRIGNVGGLTFNGSTLENQWGIYTDMGYFSGAIVSTEGKIGGFDIDGTKLYSNGHSAYNTAKSGVYIGTDYISFGNGGVTYFKDDGTGKIGKWTVGANDLYNGTIGNATSALVSVGTSSNANIGGSGASAHTWSFTAGSKFGVTSTGDLYCNSANIQGKIEATSGFIGQNATNGFTISNTAIYNPSTKSSLGSDTVNGVYVGKDGIALGKGVFKVTNAGAVTASNINATGGTIGGWSINSSYGIYTNNKTSATSTNTGILIQKDGAIYAGAYDSTKGSCPFQVTASGALIATSAEITGGVVATTGSIGGWTIDTSSISSNNSTSIKTIVAGTRTSSSTGDGVYIASNGVLNIGKESGNYLVFDGENLDLKTDWLRFDNEDESVIVGENENSSLLIKENTIRMLNPDRFEIFSANMDGALQNIYGSSYPVRQLFNNCNGVQCTAEGHMDYNFVIANGATIKTSFSAVLYENGNYSGTEADNSISFTKGTAQTINVTGRKSGIVYTIEYDGNITFCITCTPNIDKLSISLDTWVSFYTSSPSYTLGTRKEGARGAFSTTLGERLVASGEHQTVIGVNNTEDADKLFIIGNGGNVLTVSKSGRLNCYNHQSGIVSTGVQNATYGGVTTSCRYRRWDDDFVEVWTTTSITPKAANTATTKTIGIPFPNFLTKASYHGFVSIQGIPEIATCHVGLTPHAPSGDNYRYDAVTINIYASNTTTRYVNVYYCGTLTSNI